MYTKARRRRDRLRKKKKKKKTTMKKTKKHSYSVCPGGTERVASVFVGNEGRGRKRKGGHPSHPTATHVGGGCVAEEHGGGTASRQSSLRAFQYMARAFEVAGFRRGIAGRKGTPTSTGGGGGDGTRDAIDSSFNLVATHPSCRRRGKRVKAKEGPKGWRGRERRPSPGEGIGGDEPYLFECVVARDKNDDESLKSMWRKHHY